MLTLTSKTRFGAMRGCQEQTREGDLGGSPGHGWTGRPKADNILLVRWGVTRRLRTKHEDEIITCSSFYLYLINLIYNNAPSTIETYNKTNVK